LSGETNSSSSTNITLELEVDEDLIIGDIGEEEEDNTNGLIMALRHAPRRNSSRLPYDK